MSYEFEKSRHGSCTYTVMQLVTARIKLNRYSVFMAAVIAVVVDVVAAAQPELKVMPDPQPVNVGKEFRVTCVVSWSGAPDAFTILPAEVAPIDWGKVTVLPSKAYVRDGQNVVEETVAFEADNPGEYKTPAIEIPYLRPEDVQKPEKPDTPMHLNASDAPPKLRADPFPLLVQPHTTPAWLFGVLGALSFCVAAFVAWRIRKARRVVSPVESEPGQALDTTAVCNRLDAAKRKRVEGDFYGMYRELAAAAKLVQTKEPELAQRLTTRTEEVGYRGARPTDDEMDGDLRSIERLLVADEPDS